MTGAEAATEFLAAQEALKHEFSDRNVSRLAKAVLALAQAGADDQMGAAGDGG